MVRVDIKPDLLRWAYERAGLTAEALAGTFPHLKAWELGEERPTLKQLERFAKATHAPIGFLFLPAPPEEKAPIPDFRTVANKEVPRPSPDLLETVYLCEQRQEWYRDSARYRGESALRFVGSLTLDTPVEEAAATIAKELDFRVHERRDLPGWAAALRRFVEQAEEAGVLVMVNGVVGNNNKRKLDPHEFRGFVLSDPVAPLVFINGADAKAAQTFTLAHELAHLWLGRSGISNAGLVPSTTNAIERWCNQVAAELLVPLAALRADYDKHADVAGQVARLARDFKVSKLVVLRRLYDARALNRARFSELFESEMKTLHAAKPEGGGNFYLTESVRVSKRFGRALIGSALEGQTLYRDALRLLSLSKLSTFHELGKALGVA
jgi:Zn-dependent peptidase ImmA (M78 family)